MTSADHHQIRWDVSAEHWDPEAAAAAIVAAERAGLGVDDGSSGLLDRGAVSNPRERALVEGARKEAFEQEPFALVADVHGLRIEFDGGAAVAELSWAALRSVERVDGHIVAPDRHGQRLVLPDRALRADGGGIDGARAAEVLRGWHCDATDGTGPLPASGADSGAAVDGAHEAGDGDGDSAAPGLHWDVDPAHDLVAYAAALLSMVRVTHPARRSTTVRVILAGAALVCVLGVVVTVGTDLDAAGMLTVLGLPVLLGVALAPRLFDRPPGPRAFAEALRARPDLVGPHHVVADERGIRARYATTAWREAWSRYRGAHAGDGCIVLVHGNGSSHLVLPNGALRGAPGVEGPDAALAELRARIANARSGEPDRPD